MSDETHKTSKKKSKRKWLKKSRETTPESPMHMDVHTFAIIAVVLMLMYQIYLYSGVAFDHYL